MTARTPIRRKEFTQPLPARASIAGFTLIELLVVIAIISLLVSILLPSLQRAQRLARQTVCATELDRWSDSYYMYAGEYDGQLPPATNSWWPTTPWQFRPGDGKAAMQFTGAMHHVGQYMVRQEDYACAEVRYANPPPVDPHSPAGRMHHSGTVHHLGDVWWDQWAYWNYYLMLVFYQRHGADFPERMETAHPSMVMIADRTSYFETWKRNHVDGPNLLGGNFLFVDGHVAWYADAALGDYVLGEQNAVPRDRYRAP